MSLYIQMGVVISYHQGSFSLQLMNTTTESHYKSFFFEYCCWLSLQIMRSLGWKGHIILLEKKSCPSLYYIANENHYIINDVQKLGQGSGLQCPESQFSVTAVRHYFKLVIEKREINSLSFSPRSQNVGRVIYPLKVFREFFLI